MVSGWQSLLSSLVPEAAVVSQYANAAWHQLLWFRCREILRLLFRRQYLPTSSRTEWETHESDSAGRYADVWLRMKQFEDSLGTNGV